MEIIHLKLFVGFMEGQTILVGLFVSVINALFIRAERVIDLQVWKLDIIKSYHVVVNGLRIGAGNRNET